MNNSKKARTIKPSTEKKLFALSKNQCYKPNCTNKLITDDKKDVLAKIAHIEATSPNDKLCTVYNNEEIIAIENVENEFLEELTTFMERYDLND